MVTINAAATDSSITIFRGLIATVGKESIEPYQNAKLDAEFDLIMQRHGHTIEALNDR
ncbi:type II toxin-antitoxin system prevent-host-death family antitoxin [Pectobacterium carotovorum]|uniref:type II toxin-antitoxin system prevent-host-death family antitoxin n=1 Tax=Pectobacterium brasiliense TaxID=180957 RepID=UPI001F3A1E9A|nr:type II toxin-antitoxin system prevent-host-death family antitoxin [Pectobacterium carotovorum]